MVLGVSLTLFGDLGDTFSESGLDGGLKLHCFSGLPGGGPDLRQCTSGVPTPCFLAPTVSIKMAIKHQISHIESSNRKESKHAMGIGCRMTKSKHPNAR